MMKRSRLLSALLILFLIGIYFSFDLGRFLDLDYFKAQQAVIESWRAANPLAAAGIFFLTYIAVTALSLPGATIMTLIGGAIFGLLWGLLVISFASTIGATLAFLISRFLLRDWVQSRFATRLGAINEGIKKEGGFYLFTLRLVPIFPFFIINLVMGLTPLPAWTFYWVSQLGMLAGTVVYVNAGTQLARIESAQGILSPSLLASFALLGIFPLLAKRIVILLKARRIYKKWSRPSRFDRNLVVIGAGSAGLVTAYIAAAVKAKITLIEKHKMGGDCLNTGCVPSKAFIRSAKLLSQIQRSREFGLREAHVEFDFAEVMQRVQRIVEKIAPHDSVDRYTQLGVEVLQGEAKITSPWSVQITSAQGIQILTARSIVIATGAAPFVPVIPGLEEVGYLTSDTIWNLRQCPRRLVVVGGGPIGCELAQAFARLGCHVTVVEMLPRILMVEDEEVSEAVTSRFHEDGLEIRTQHRAQRFLTENGEKRLICEDLCQNNREVHIPFDEVLIAVGRIANTTGFGVEELGIPLTESRSIQTNASLQTIYPNIYACGDVVGPYQFTHVAAHQAWYSAVNALFSPFRRFRADYSVIPWATFVDPEVARVGLNESAAKQRGIPYEVTRYGIDDLDRAIIDEEAHGFVKVLTVPNKDKILGVTIVGEHAAELIAEYVLAMRHGIGLNKILGTIHIYPTFCEANKYAAGQWKRVHAPKKLLQWLARFHRWRRKPNRASIKGVK